MNKYLYLSLWAVLIGFISFGNNFSSNRKITSNLVFSEPKAPIFESDSDKEEEKEVIVEEEKPAFHPINDYRASRKIVHDLVHTNLDVRFEWAKAYLHGKAILTLKPHFYASNRLELDAKGFEIREVALLSSNQGKTSKTPLKYTYDGKMINIELNKSYVKDEKYNIFIDYTAKPDELPKGGSEAITEDKGLYFINKDGKDPNKPMQIWTQGETEASSCWFPTIDAPNQKSTQEIAMTVDKKYITLSNGLMTSTKTNADGTRTDVWKQNKPHAPYLFMMAVGEFAIVKDKWRNIEVNYYVEPKYKDSAKDIFAFGKTPKMIEFFSKILKVDFVWDKYHQIIVRDYVSGAMENSSAVIFGEFAQQTKRELLDLNHEDIVAHELLHHWFGDLVTCESFSNLPLNESFATYAPYLWFESEYGQDFMDYERYKSLQGYFQEAEETPKDLIRYFYKSREDMFDAHSYNKGGGVLHSLRRYVGDDAFFTALNLYLTRNQFGSAEIHDLRLAFEKVTGEDLNWFFNQWFLQSGHPQITIDYQFDETKKQQKIVLEQIQADQKGKAMPYFKLPLKVDFYLAKEVLRKEIVMTEKRQEFVFDLPEKPQMVNVDAEKSLLGTKTDNKTLAEYLVQFQKAPLFLDRLEALQAYALAEQPEAKQIFTAALNDKFWFIREFAIQNAQAGFFEDKTFIEKVENLAQNDPKSSVRTMALNKLGELKANKYKEIFKKRITTDSSYAVINSSLLALKDLDLKEAKNLAENSKDKAKLVPALARIYAEEGSEGKSKFFEENYAIAAINDKVDLIVNYASYLTMQKDDKTIDQGIVFFQNVCKETNPWWMKIMGMRALGQIARFYAQKEMALSSDPNAKTDMENVSKRKNNLRELIEKIKSEEKYEGVLPYFEQIK